MSTTGVQPAGPADVTVVLFRDDLRVADNPALHAALERQGSVIALYVLDEVSSDIRPLGGASRWWLHESLLALRASLEPLGVPLVLRKGATEAVVRLVVAESGATRILWNRRYGLAEIAIDTRLKSQLRACGLEAASSQASLLFEPWTIRTGGGTPYSVFTPFWRACLAGPEPRAPLPVPRPAAVTAPSVDTDTLEQWALQPSTPDWASGLRRTWVPGEESARARLQRFLDDELEGYSLGRDFPAQHATSRLSPHLRWGEISPHQIWHEVRAVRPSLSPSGADGAAKFLSEVGWREFSWHVLFHSPRLAETPWRSEFDEFQWPVLDRRALEAWQRGQTGIPLVDAGMRELWQTGAMHNRVRMVTASFLTKNLLIDWREGERWFWDTLVDADPAANPFNWQWVAGSGADAAPYFRIFNPEVQARKFDPQRSYILQYVPECEGAEYPAPIVDLADSRRAALATHLEMKARVGERKVP